MSIVLAIEVRVENKFLWVKTTPLGTPVDPEVYIMIAASFLKNSKSKNFMYTFSEYLFLTAIVRSKVLRVTYLVVGSPLLIIACHR